MSIELRGGQERMRRSPSGHGPRVGASCRPDAGSGLRVAALAALVLPALLWFASGPAAASEPGPAVSAVLTGVRVWTGPETTRLVFETTQPVMFASVRDSSRSTIQVLFKNAVPAPAVPAVREVNDGAIRTIRVAEVPNGVEVRVELVQFSAATPFAMDPDAVPARVALDVPRPGQAARQTAEQKTLRELAERRARVVVIDPGHGGEATGAVGPRRTIEKDVCLAIARRLAEKLNDEKGVRAFLTRDGDYNVALRDRYHYAERLHADAFVSIHANSGKRPKGRGTEVYFLSLASASDEQSKHLADVENAADLVGGVSASEGDLVSILFDLKQNAVIRQSSELAEAVLDQIVDARRLSSRGVKQAPFAVLKSPVVPSVLVETAFINHPEEARLLRDSDFQKEIAEQIARGVLQYLETAPPAARVRSGSGGRDSTTTKHSGS